MGIDQLREQLRCQVTTPDDAGYDEARAVHNGMFDRRPRAVVRAEQVADVMAAVNFAREDGLDLCAGVGAGRSAGRAESAPSRWGPAGGGCPSGRGSTADRDAVAGGVPGERP